jgi:hypothetical protein
VVTDGVAEDGAGDAFVVRLCEGLSGEEPIDDGFGVASPAVERLAATVSGVQAGRVGEGEQGGAGGEVRFAVDPVDVPTAAERLGGQGQGGDCFAAACLADDEGLASPGVERGGDDGPASVGEAPVPDVSAERQAENGPAVGAWPGRPPHGPVCLGAVAPFLAQLAVVAGGFVLVAVMQDCRKERRGEDAAGHPERDQFQQLSRVERVVEPEVGPQGDDGVVVGVPPAGEHDQAGEDSSGQEGGPASPPAVLDRYGERGGDDQGGKTDGQPADDHRAEHQGLDPVEVRFRSARLGGRVHAPFRGRVKAARSATSTRSASPRAWTAVRTAARTLPSPVM